MRFPLTGCAQATILTLVSLILLSNYAYGAGITPVLDPAKTTPSGSNDRTGDPTTPDPCMGTAYCGTDGQQAGADWNYPTCTESSCGTETWYVTGLSPSVATYAFSPAVTSGTQITLLLLTIASNAAPGSYTFQVGATCSAKPCGPASALLVVLPQPTIYFDGNPVVGTTPINVVVGQQILLDAQFPTGVMPLTQSWNIQGNPIADFYHSPTCPTQVLTQPPATSIVCTGSKTSLSASDLAKSPVSFYWVTASASGSSYLVTYTYTLSTGVSGPVTLTFQVSGPTSVTMSSGVPNDVVSQIIPKVNGVDYVGCGNGFANPIIYCIAIHESVSPPTGNVGTIQFVQLILSNKDNVTTAPGQTHVCTTATGLDNTYPDSATSPQLSDGNPFAWDAPSWPLQLGSNQVSFEAKTYLMWTPSTPTGVAAIPVPLGFVVWSWHAHAIESGSGSVVKNPLQGVTPGSFQPSGEYPTWNAVVLNVNGVQC